MQQPHPAPQPAGKAQLRQAVRAQLDALAPGDPRWALILRLLRLKDL